MSEGTDRVHRVDTREANGETRRIFETYQQERGNVPNMFRTIAHRPELLRTMIAHFRAVMSPGTVNVRTKELVSLVVSGINDCDY